MLLFLLRDAPCTNRPLRCVVRKHAVSAMDLEEDIHRIVIHPVNEELA